MSSLRPGPELAGIEHAAELLGELAQRDRPMGELTTYRVGGRAALFAEPESATELTRLAEVAATTGIEVVVLGKGSNLLVSDAGFRGLCIRLGEGFALIEIESDRVRLLVWLPRTRCWRGGQPRRGSPASNGPWASPARSEAP